MSRLHDVLRWAVEQGDEKALDRIRVFALSHVLAERIDLAKVGPNDDCSPEALAAIIGAAEMVVGMDYPQ